MAIEKKQAYSQIAITKKRSSRQTDDDELCSLVPPTTFKSLGSTPSTDAVIITGEKETLELKKKKKKSKFVTWWDDVDGMKESSSVVKRLPKSKYAAPIWNSCVSSITNLHETKKKKKDERSLPSIHHNNFIDLCNDRSYRDGNNKENQDRVGFGRMFLEGFGVQVEDPRLGEYMVKDMIYPLDSSFSSLEKETNTKKDEKRSLPSSHRNIFIDLSGGELGKSSSSSDKGNRHVSLEELGVSVEDLKSMPWEAFDPTWEIRSETMDPWLGGYIKDKFSADQ